MSSGAGGESCTGCVEKADLVEKAREDKRGDSNPHGHDAFQGYRERFKKDYGRGPIFNRKAFPWRTPGEEEKRSPPIDEELRAELEQDMGVKLEPDANQEILEPTELSTTKWDWTKQARREKLGESSVVLCAKCRLPLGDIVYTVRDAGLLHMHGECMAQHLLNDLTKKKTRRTRLRRRRLSALAARSTTSAGSIRSHATYTLRRRWGPSSRRRGCVA